MTRLLRAMLRWLFSVEALIMLGVIATGVEQAGAS